MFSSRSSNITQETSTTPLFFLADIEDNADKGEMFRTLIKPVTVDDSRLGTNRKKILSDRKLITKELDELTISAQDVWSMIRLRDARQNCDKSLAWILTKWIDMVTKCASAVQQAFPEYTLIVSTSCESIRTGSLLREHPERTLKERLELQMQQPEPENWSLVCTTLNRAINRRYRRVVYDISKEENSFAFHAILLPDPSLADLEAVDAPIDLIDGIQLHDRISALANNWSPKLNLLFDPNEAPDQTIDMWTEEKDIWRLLHEVPLHEDIKESRLRQELEERLNAIEVAINTQYPLAKISQAIRGKDDYRTFVKESFAVLQEAWGTFDIFIPSEATKALLAEESVLAASASAVRRTQTAWNATRHGMRGLGFETVKADWISF